MQPRQQTIRITIIIAVSALIHIAIGAWSTMPSIIYKPKNEDSTTVVIQLKEEPQTQKTKPTQEPTPKPNEKKTVDPQQELAKTAPSTKPTPKKETPKKEAPKKEAPKKITKKKAANKINEKKAKASQKTSPETKTTTQTKVKTEQPDREKKPEKAVPPHQKSMRALKQKLGNMKHLDDKAMQKAAVTTQASSIYYEERQKTGVELYKALSKNKQQAFSKHLSSALKLILRSFNPPQKDGQKYYGEVRVLINKSGYITSINLKKPSGNNQLDFAMLSAVKRTSRLQIPDDPDVAAVFTELPLLLHYDESDLAN